MKFKQGPPTLENLTLEENIHDNFILARNYIKKLKQLQSKPIKTEQLQEIPLDKALLRAHS
jgi:hypothetical protein